MGVYPGDKPPTTEERAELKAPLLKDRRPAYIPWMVRAFGPPGGLLMSQLLFWDGKGHDPEGWIYKTEKEWELETGLTRTYLRKGRTVLKGKGVLEEERRGVPYRLYYRANLQALMALQNGEPLPSATDERSKDPEDTGNEDPRHEVESQEKTGHGEDAHPPVHIRHISEEGITSLPSEEGNSRLTRKETNTFPASEEGVTSLPNEEGITDPAYTESTSENNAKSSHRKEAGEPAFQAAADEISSAAVARGNREEVELEHRSANPPEPTSIFEPLIKKHEEKTNKPYRATTQEIQRIYYLLTDEQFPTCGAYRRFEEGRLSDQHLLEAVSYELTGEFLEWERYREAVEGCVRILKEEEGIA